MKTLGLLAAILVAAVLAALLFLRSRRVVETWEAAVQPAGGAVRRVPQESSAPLEEVRERVGMAMLETHQAAPGRSLQVSVTLRVERRAFRFGIPPWSTVSDARQTLAYGLHLDPGPSPAWIPMVGNRALDAVSQDQAREAVLEELTRELRRFRNLRQAFP